MHLSLCFWYDFAMFAKKKKYTKIVHFTAQQKKTHNERVKANQPIAKACYFAYSFYLFYFSKDDYVSRTYFIFFFHSLRTLLTTIHEFPIDFFHKVCIKIIT